MTFGPVAAAGHATLEGHVDPVRVTEVLLAEAAKLGARVQHPCEVTGLDQPQGRLRAVKTSSGDIPADVLVVACGTDTPRVARLAGLTVPLKESPGVLVHTAPLPALIDRVILAPAAHMKQKPDGRVVTGVGFGGTPSKDASREGGEAFLKMAATVLPALRGATLEKVTLGWRPLPADEFPIVGTATRAGRLSRGDAQRRHDGAADGSAGRDRDSRRREGRAARALPALALQVGHAMDALTARRDFLTQAALAVVASATGGVGWRAARRPSRPAG